MVSTGKAILNAIRQELNLSDYRKKHWEGSFDEYLDIVREHPEVTRTARPPPDIPVSTFAARPDRAASGGNSDVGFQRQGHPGHHPPAPEPQ